MARKTIAQLEAENAALRERNQKLQANVRQWRSAGVFKNNRKEDPDDSQPDWNSTSIRLIVTEELRPGDPFWIDTNLRVYDPETCPLSFDEEKTQPEFIVSARACSPQWAQRQEKGFQDSQPNA